MDSLTQIMNKLPEELQRQAMEEIMFHAKQFRGLLQREDRKSVAYSIHKKLDEYASSINYSERGIICAKGCSFCCRQKVDITAAEALLLLGYAKEEGIEIDYEKAEKQADMLMEKYCHELSFEDRGCVFLNKEGDCGAYKHRPAMCRKYFSTGKTKEECDDPLAKVPIFADIRMELMTVGMMMADETDSLPKLLLKYRHVENP